MQTKKHSIKNLEVSFIEFRDDSNNYFKVTRNIPALPVKETRFFSSKYDAKKQFEEWLH